MQMVKDNIVDLSGVWLDTPELQEWLEWAGSILLSMQISSPKPKPPGTFWPEFAQDFREAYGYTNERLRAPLPSARDINLMDQILELPSLASDMEVRRIIHARLLVTPVSNRYVNTWVKLAVRHNTDRRKVSRLHQIGLVEICRKLGKDKIYALRKSFQSVTL